MKKIFLTAATALILTSVQANAQTDAQTKNNAPNSVFSAAEDYDLDYKDDNDPLEPVNRAIFKFNNVVDGYVIRPVAVGYRYVVPAWGRQRVTNVFYNISEPVTVLNSVLQADPENAFTALWRFIINSTFGLLGTFDAASELGLKARPEDFGQTLGVWGVKDSTYIVLPILGPSTLRDGVSLAADYYTNPFYNGMIVHDDDVVWGMVIVNGLNKRTNLLDVTDDIDKNSLDPYATYRSAYLQKRANDIANGKE